MASIKLPKIVNDSDGKERRVKVIKSGENSWQIVYTD
jgi:hypothetical protein